MAAEVTTEKKKRKRPAFIVVYCNTAVLRSIDRKYESNGILSQVVPH